MGAEEIRRKVVAFVRAYYEKHKVAPPIRLVSGGTGLSLKEIYGGFPDGQGGICRESGIPVPKARMERTRRATKRRVRKAQRARKREERTESPVSTRTYRLTPEQQNRFLGILHLEPERGDIRSIIDDWLDMDKELRVRWGLRSTDEIVRAVDLAREVDQIGVNVKELVDSHRLFKRAGVPFNPDQLQTLARFLQELIDGGWPVEEIPNYVTALWLCGVTKLSRDDMYRFLDLFDASREAGKSPGDYVRAFYEERDELRTETEGLKAKKKQLIEEVADLKRRKERVVKDLRFYEEAKNKRVREFTKAHPWTKQQDAKVKEVLKSMSSSMGVKGGSSGVKAVENPEKPKGRTLEADREFAEELEKWAHDIIQQLRQKRPKVEAGPESRRRKKPQARTAG